MSPKFGLAFLLLCFVLLGLSDAQRQQQQHTGYRVRVRYQGRPTGFGAPDDSVSPDYGVYDCHRSYPDRIRPKKR